MGEYIGDSPFEAAAKIVVIDISCYREHCAKRTCTSTELMRTINDWCKDNLGGKFGCRVWRIWLFDNDEDAVMFRMKWCVG